MSAVSSVEELLHVGEENPLAVLPFADSLVTCVTKSTLGVPVAPDVAIQSVRRQVRAEEEFEVPIVKF